MIPGYHTQNLVSELYRITDHGTRIIGSSQGFAWLSKYKSSGGNQKHVKLLALSGLRQMPVWGSSLQLLAMS